LKYPFSFIRPFKNNPKLIWWNCVSVVANNQGLFEEKMVKSLPQIRFVSKILTLWKRPKSRRLGGYPSNPRLIFFLPYRLRG